MTDADRWEVYPAEIDGEMAIVVVDLACAELAPIAGLPVLHWLRLAPPQETEGTDAVAAREDREARAHDVFAAGAARAVGSITSRLRRELYWYAPEAFDPRADLMELFGEAQGRAWSHKAEADPSWNHYAGVLLPSVTDRRRLQVARALASLAERGDQLEAPRLVEYRALFESRSGLEGFLRATSGGGYRVAAPVESVAGKWRARVGIRQALDPDEVQSRIAAIATLAEAHGGAYEGWDTHAVQQKGRGG